MGVEYVLLSLSLTPTARLANHNTQLDSHKQNVRGSLCRWFSSLRPSVRTLVCFASRGFVSEARLFPRCSGHRVLLSNVLACYATVTRSLLAIRAQTVIGRLFRWCYWFHWLLLLLLLLLRQIVLWSWAALAVSKKNKKKHAMIHHRSILTQQTVCMSRKKKNGAVYQHNLNGIFRSD